MMLSKGLLQVGRGRARDLFEQGSQNQFVEGLRRESHGLIAVQVDQRTGSLGAFLDRGEGFGAAEGAHQGRFSAVAKAGDRDTPACPKIGLDALGQGWKRKPAAGCHRGEDRSRANAGLTLLVPREGNDPGRARLMARHEYAAAAPGRPRPRALLPGGSGWGPPHRRRTRSRGGRWWPWACWSAARRRASAWGCWRGAGTAWEGA